jgi:hypothetical protein
VLIIIYNNVYDEDIEIDKRGVARARRACLGREEAQARDFCFWIHMMKLMCIVLFSLCVCYIERRGVCVSI